MLRLPPRSTRTDTLFPYTTLFRSVRAAGVLLCVFALAGCSTIKGWFDGKDKDKSAEPSELTELTPTATVGKLWSAKAGKGEGLLGVRQAPAIADGRVYAAAVEGGVQAFDLQTGATLWTFDSDLALRSEEHTSELQSLMRS